MIQRAILCWSQQCSASGARWLASITMTEANRQCGRNHEVTQTHKEAANLQMNQSDMKEAVKTAILQDDHVLLNLTSIILSMAKNHDSLTSFPARCLAAEMLSVEAEGLCLFARFCSNRVGGRACCT